MSSEPSGTPEPGTTPNSDYLKVIATNMIEEKVGRRLEDRALDAFNPFFARPGVYYWRFEGSYENFPTKRPSKFSIEDRKRCFAALMSGEAKVVLSTPDVPGYRSTYEPRTISSTVANEPVLSVINSTSFKSPVPSHLTRSTADSSLQYQEGHNAKAVAEALHSFTAMCESGAVSGRVKKIVVTLKSAVHSLQQNQKQLEKRVEQLKQLQVAATHRDTIIRKEEATRTRSMMSSAMVTFISDFGFDKGNIGIPPPTHVPAQAAVAPVVLPGSTSILPFTAIESMVRLSQGTIVAPSAEPIDSLQSCRDSAGEEQLRATFKSQILSFLPTLSGQIKDTNPPSVELSAAFVKRYIGGQDFTFSRPSKEIQKRQCVDWSYLIKINTDKHIGFPKPGQHGYLTLLPGREPDTNIGKVFPVLVKSPNTGFTYQGHYRVTSRHDIPLELWLVQSEQSQLNTVAKMRDSLWSQTMLSEQGLLSLSGSLVQQTNQISRLFKSPEEPRLRMQAWGLEFVSYSDKDAGVLRAAHQRWKDNTKHNTCPWFDNFVLGLENHRFPRKVTGDGNGNSSVVMNTPVGESISHASPSRPALPIETMKTQRISVGFHGADESNPHNMCDASPAPRDVKRKAPVASMYAGRDSSSDSDDEYLPANESSAKRARI